MSTIQARVFMAMTAKSFLEMSASVRQYPAKQEMMKFMFSPYWLVDEFIISKMRISGNSGTGN